MTQSTDTQTGTIAEYAYSGMKRYSKKVIRPGQTSEVTLFIGDHFEQMPNGETRSYISAEFGEGSGMAISTIQTRSGSEVIHFTHSDHLGSSGVMTDSAGNIVELTSYYPFGELRHDLTSTDFVERHKFTGHEFDTETGLVYANAGYYHPGIGRFVSGDPLQGRPTEFLEKFGGDAQGLNYYSYARNNPIILTDPSGESYVGYTFWRGYVNSILKLKGYNITASFVEHAVPWTNIFWNTGKKVEKLTFSNDSDIAQSIKWSTKYNNVITEIIGKNISDGKLSGSDSFSFNPEDGDIDLYYSLHAVNYSYRANMISESEYDLQITITDVYDFTKSQPLTTGDFSTLGNLGNEAGVLLQRTGELRPFDVEIRLNERIYADQRSFGSNGSNVSWRRSHFH